MIDEKMMLVPLHHETVARLIESRKGPDETLDSVLVRLTDQRCMARSLHSAKPTAVLPGRAKSGRYRATVLGESIATSTLGGLLANVLNLLADLDGGFLSQFSSFHGRTRRHVARNREAIHPGRDDLNRRYACEFRPGWWMGTNYSATDVRRILTDVCKCTEISFGRDLIVKL